MTGPARRYGEDRELTRDTWRAIGVVVATAVAVVGVLAFALARGVGMVLGRHAHAWLWAAAGLLLLVLLTALRARSVRQAMRAAARALDPVPADHPVSIMLERLCAQADLTAPALGTCDGAPNAYVVIGPGGRPTIVVTRGLLAACPPEELEAVLAHELFHIAHGDTWAVAVLEGLGAAADDRSMTTGRDLWPPTRWTLAAVRAVVVVLNMLSWRSVGAVQQWLHESVRAVLRKRELAADAAAAQLTGRATVLTDAILRCSGGALTPGTDLRVVAAVGFVAEPGREQGRDATHPAPAERAALLARLATRLGAR